MFRDFKPEIKLFLIVALVAVVSVGGILLLKTLQATPPVAEQIPPPPAPQPQTEVLDTSNWQTYRNEELGYTVKYPSGGSFGRVPSGIADLDAKGDFTVGFKIKDLSIKIKVFENVRQDKTL